MFFQKKVYKYQEMNFILDDVTDPQADLIDIEAYGYIDGEMKHCCSSFSLKKQEMYENGDFESMLNLLRTPEGRKVTVELIYNKKGIFKGFRLMPDSLAKAYDDERFLQLELVEGGQYILDN